MEQGDTRNKTERNAQINQKVSTYSSSDLTRNALNNDNSTDIGKGMKYLLKQDLKNIKIIDCVCNKSNKRDIPVMCNTSVETNVCIDHDEKTCEVPKHKEQIVSSDNLSNQEIIEIWNKSTQRAKIKKKLNNDTTERQSKKQGDRKLFKQISRKLSFETWRKEKNVKYRKLVKETEKKQWESQEKKRNVEYKKVSQKTYTQAVREKKVQPKTNLSVKKSQVIQQTDVETLQRQIDERHLINDQAFNVWKKQKDVKLKEAKLTTMKNVSHDQLKKSASPTPLMFIERPSLQFNLWLDQLNSVLHKKYLRERRHLVRSFYCQPIYYGV